MPFDSFLSGGFITANLVNPPERKLAERTSVQYDELEEIVIFLLVPFCEPPNFREAKMPTLITALIITL